MKQFDAVTLGEALIDFVPIDEELLGRFKATPGGAPANVAYGLGKLGNKVALVSRIGNDPLGAFILQTMDECGVETKYVQRDNERHTTVTIVMPRSEDMLRYAIYRSGSADGALSFEEIPAELLANTRILHCGSLAMSSPIANETTLKAIASAKRHGAIISVDVNLRPNSWSSQEEMIAQSRKLIGLSDIVKMTKDESQVLNLSPAEIAGTSDKIILVTDGGEGAAIYNKSFQTACKAPVVEVVDATGAGDAFTSAFLHYYLEHADKLEMEELLTSGVRFAVYAGAEAVQKHGAIMSLPNLEQMTHMGQQLKELPRY